MMESTTSITTLLLFCEKYEGGGSENGVLDFLNLGGDEGAMLNFFVLVLGKLHLYDLAQGTASSFTFY